MNEDELRHELHDAVPEPPAVPDRAAGARQRARRTHRRRTALAGIVGTALVVAALATAPALLSGGRSDSPAPAAPTFTSSDFSCSRDAPIESDDEVGTVPAGAVAVWLCRNDDSIDMGFVEPAEALVNDVDDLAELINGQPVQPESGSCITPAGTGYRLVFGYRDGSEVSVSGSLSSCGRLTVGDSIRANPAEPFNVFLQMLEDQGSKVPPLWLVTPTDPPPAIDADSSADDVVAAYVALLNLGDRATAAKLWSPRVRKPEFPSAHTHIAFQVESVKEMPMISAWQDATVVRGLYRERPADAYEPDREAFFSLGRDEQGVLRIVGMQLGDPAETGR